ncbi:MAG TPA: SdiA-regulated domain-containing protein [Ferruginibacter sp.]|nr:SdiA-regulated domain-containing protein [Ferruginibacter sp.]
MIQKLHIACLCVWGILAIYSCDSSNKKKHYQNTDMYELANPKVIKLPEELDEISGIAYYPKDTSVFAIVDEDGLLFKIPIKNPAAFRKWEFGKKKDYEDVVLIDSTFYVLVSNGNIETIRFIGDKLHTDKTDFSDETKQTTEFEAMYLDKDSGNLIILCKACDADPKTSFSSYSYNLRDTSKLYSPYIVFNMSQLAQESNMDKRLKASAAAINPVTNDLYIISSVLKLLVITDSKGAFKNVIKLDPVIYKQPEGIAFTPEGDLIISNEFGEEGFANLLILKNKKKGK